MATEPTPFPKNVYLRDEGELTAFLKEQSTANQCERCNKGTLGLDGDPKWCCYCGAKLWGDLFPETNDPSHPDYVAAQAAESVYKEDIAPSRGGAQWQHELNEQTRQKPLPNERENHGEK